MSSKRSDTTEDWLSAPVGGGNGRGPSSGAVRTSAPSAPAYADPTSSPRQDRPTEQRSVYPNGYPTGATSSALSPGPATSIGLGSAATSTVSTAAAGARTGQSARRPARGPRRAKLQIRHLDPWSTLKLALVLAIAFFFVWMVAVGVLYGVLNGMGVFDKINSTYAEFSTTAGGSGSALITTKVVFGGAALVGLINVVLFTALATIGSYIYNLCADLVGGLEITLAERR